MTRTLLTALGSGALTLGIEIVAGRLLAPYFGSSLHQWAALIGVVLLAYVIGYGVFERLTRRGPALILAAGGVYALLLPLWLFEGLDSIVSLPLEVASVSGAIVAAGVPSALWAGVLPYLQRRSGAGARVLAWSAIGNLAGAWGVAFIGVPWAGTRATLLGLGVLAILLALAWYRELGSRAQAVALVAAVVAAALLGVSATRSTARPWEVAHSVLGDEPTTPTLVALRDSPYQEIAVWDEGEGTGRRRALALNGSLQFLWSENEELTAGGRYEYYNFSTAAAAWTASGEAKSALILGLGGGLIPWQLKRFYPSIELGAIELDPGVVAAARAHLPLAKSGVVDVVIGDGRTRLRTDGKRYDYILVDTFLNSYVPFHLTTREFFALARSRLNPGGVLVANFHTVFASSGLLPSLETTIGDVFPSVAVLDLAAGTTLVMAAAEAGSFPTRLRAAARSSASALTELSQRAADGVRPANHDGRILTDDHNDTEQRLYETRRLVRVSRPI